MSALEDEDLRDFYADGYHRLTGRLTGWHSRAWAEDLVQDALLRAWERARDGEDLQSLPAWVTTVATNLARSRLRRQQAEQRALRRLIVSRPEWVVGRVEEPDPGSRDVADLLAALPLRQRQVMALRYVADLDHVSIADLLGIDVGTVKSTLSRRRRAIERRLATQAPRSAIEEERVRTVKHWMMTGAAPQDYEFGVSETLRQRARVAFLRSRTKQPRDFGAICQVISAEEYRGHRVRLSADLKAVDVTGWAGLWLRVDGDGAQEPLAFDNMEERALRGATDWERHAIVLDVTLDADAVFLGALVSGGGELRLSRMAFEVVSPDVPLTASQPTRPRHPRNLDFSEFTGTDA